MKREAFKMYLKPGYEAEYEKRHAAIWPELKASFLLSRKRKVREARRTWELQRLYRNGGTIWQISWK